MNSAPRSGDGERSARHQRGDAGADRVSTPRFIGEPYADRSSHVGKVPRFSWNIEHERGIDGLIEPDHGVHT